MEVQQEIKDAFHGSVTAVCWVEFDGRKDEGFAYGCVNGSIHVYKWSAIAVSSLPKNDISAYSLSEYVLCSRQARYVFVSMVDAHPAQVQALEFNARFRRVASIGDGTPRVWRLDGQGA